MAAETRQRRVAERAGNPDPNAVPEPEIDPERPNRELDVRAEPPIDQRVKGADLIKLSSSATTT